MHQTARSSARSTLKSSQKTQEATARKVRIGPAEAQLSIYSRTFRNVLDRGLSVDPISTSANLPVFALAPVPARKAASLHNQLLLRLTRSITHSTIAPTPCPIQHTSHAAAPTNNQNHAYTIAPPSEGEAFPFTIHTRPATQPLIVHLLRKRLRLQFRQSVVQPTLPTRQAPLSGFDIIDHTAPPHGFPHELPRMLLRMHPHPHPVKNPIITLG